MNEIAIPGLVKATLAQHLAQARVEYERTVKALDGRPLLTPTAKHLRVRRNRLEAEYKAWEWLLAATNKTVCGAGSDAPNAIGDEVCGMPSDHDGRHADGILTWPRGEGE